MKKKVAWIICFFTIVAALGLSLYMSLHLNLHPRLWIGILILSSLGGVYCVGGCKSHIVLPILSASFLISWIIILCLNRPSQNMWGIDMSLWGISGFLPLLDWSILLIAYLRFLCIIHFIICLLYGSWSRVYVGIKRRHNEKLAIASLEQPDELGWYHKISRSK